MVVAVATLPRWAQLSAAVLSTPVAMCSSGAMHGVEKLDVGDVCHQLQVIDGQKTLGILIGENVGSNGSDECLTPYVPLP